MKTKLPALLSSERGEGVKKSLKNSQRNAKLPSDKWRLVVRGRDMSAGQVLLTLRLFFSLGSLAPCQYSSHCCSLPLGYTFVKWLRAWALKPDILNFQSNSVFKVN